MRGPIRSTPCSAARLNPESVLVLVGDTLVTQRRARLHDTESVELRPVISGGCTVKCRRLPRRPAVIDVTPAQHGVLRRLLPAPLRRAGAKRRPLPPDARAGRARAGGGVGRQGLPRAVGRAAPTSATRRTACTWDSASASTPTSRAACATGLRRRAGMPPWSRSTSRPTPGSTSRRARPARKRAPVRGLWAVEAAPASITPPSTAATTWWPRATTSTTRRPSLLGNILRWKTDVPRPSVPGAAGGARLRAQGEAARARRPARDCGLLRHPRHRLPGRGVPDGRGQQAPRVQGVAQRPRGPLARHQGRVPVRVHRAGPRALHGHHGAGAARPRRVHQVRAPTPVPDSGAAPMYAFCKLADRMAAGPVDVQLRTKG